MPESPPTSTEGGFSEIWALADAIPGWLTSGQAALLHRAGRTLPAGAAVVEIGSHQGRSTVVLAPMRCVPAAVASWPSTRSWTDGCSAAARRVTISSDTSRWPVSEDTVELVCDYSTKARKSWTRPFDMLYIDGKHDYWTLSDDLRWRVHLPERRAGAGPRLLLVDRGDPRHPAPRAARREPPLRAPGGLAGALPGRAADAAATALRILAEMPWWARNVVIKVLLRLRLRPVARLLGHDSPYDPY